MSLISPRSAKRAILARGFAAALALSFIAAPALASEASDAFKKAKEMQKAAKNEGDEAKKKELQDAYAAFVKERAEALKTATLSRMDLTYLAQLQAMAGSFDDAVASARKAVESKEETKYGAEIHLNLIDVLLDKGDIDAAAEEAGKFVKVNEGHKLCKTALVNVGMAYRKKLDFAKSAQYLDMALQLPEWAIVKALVNNYMMLGQKDKAIAVVKHTIEKGPAVIKDDMNTLLAITEKTGEKFTLPKFESYVPVGEPELDGKVIVLAVWNASAKTLKWTFKVLDAVKSGYGDNVTPLAVTTYYKKNVETGKMDESVTPEQERGWGAQLKDQFGFGGRLAYYSSEAELKEIGMSALPHVVVIGKDGKLLFAHTMNTLDNTDMDILKKVLDEATKE